MIASIYDLLAENARLLVAHRQEAMRLAVAYGWHVRTVAPLEQPSKSWLAARELVEQQAGCTLRRFYMDRNTA